MSSVVADLAEAIEDCSTTLVAIRFHPPPVENGRVTAKPVEEQIEFLGSFQPLRVSSTNKGAQRLPEGTRADGRAKIFTAFRLKTADAPAGRLADRVIYNGVTYLVDRVKDWADLGGYYQAEVVRMGQ